MCRADARSISATRAIRCDEILGIALGKQSSVFKKPEAALAPAAHCFSIIAAKQSLHLQSWNERDSDTYAFGIASLCKQYAPVSHEWLRTHVSRCAMQQSSSDLAPSR